MKIKSLIKFLLLILFFIFPYSLHAKKIPNLIGTWEGENIKSSVKKGFVRSNYKKKLIDLTDVRINLKSKK